MAYDRNPSSETSRGGCQPLRSFRRAEDAVAVGSEPYLCSCGYWHRRYAALPGDTAEDAGERAILRAGLGEILVNRHGRVLNERKR